LGLELHVGFGAALAVERTFVPTTTSRGWSRYIISAPI
jgi:hypothetical protein